MTMTLTLGRWLRCPLAIALAVLVFGRPAAAQADSAAEAMIGATSDGSGVEAVLAVVDRLFEGMRTADSALVRSVFHADAVLIGTENREGEPVTSVRPIDGFVRAVGGATGEWDEPFWDWEVRVDENLASVWTDYAFYVDGEFSHCGVDAFLLARDGPEWKIVSLADTRRREGCEDPPPEAR